MIDRWAKSAVVFIFYRFRRWLAGQASDRQALVTTALYGMPAKHVAAAATILQRACFYKYRYGKGDVAMGMDTSTGNWPRSTPRPSATASSIKCPKPSRCAGYPDPGRLRQELQKAERTHLQVNPDLSGMHSPLRS